MDRDSPRLIVRAGAAWSGVGTLAVALRGIAAPCFSGLVNCPAQPSLNALPPRLHLLPVVQSRLPNICTLLDTLHDHRAGMVPQMPAPGAICFLVVHFSLDFLHQI